VCVGVCVCEMWRGVVCREALSSTCCVRVLCGSVHFKGSQSVTQSTYSLYTVKVELLQFGLRHLGNLNF
jgi:hypothetical protein